MAVVILAPVLGAVLLALVLALGAALRRPGVVTVGECRHAAGEPCRHRPAALPAAGPREVEEAQR